MKAEARRVPILQEPPANLMRRELKGHLQGRPPPPLLHLLNLMRRELKVSLMIKKHPSWIQRESHEERIERASVRDGYLRRRQIESHEERIERPLARGYHEGPEYIESHEERIESEPRQVNMSQDCVTSNLMRRELKVPCIPS